MTCVDVAGIGVFVAVARDAGRVRAIAGRVATVSGSTRLTELTHIAVRTRALLHGDRPSGAAPAAHAFTRRIQLHVVQESHTW